ncbi:protein arginine N-methyltransferase 9-like [Anticarsia gemmatalis]|uniref:protein arginine N-methyltransferase 9-like n=1 Tax=Anticarsia gemmatalis TaxID=129554 RepID=UPI003F76A6F6
MDELAREYITFARQLSTTGCFSKSFDFYMMAFDKCADMKAQHEHEFRVVLNRLNEVLVTADKMEDIFNNFGRAMDAFPDNIYFLNDIGKYLFKYAFYTEAWHHFKKALSLDSGFVNAEKNLNSVKNLLVERWHYRMLNDKVRNEAYRDAISHSVVPIQDSVLDLGTGTGLLAMYANERKPMAITACDGSAVMTKLAECITQENGYDHIIVVNKLSTAMNYRDIGGKRSLLLTEMFDAGLFGEHVLQTLSHAWEYLINNVGRVVPNKAEFFVIGAKCEFLSMRYQLCSYIKTLLNIPNLNVHILTYDETYDCEDVGLYGNDIKYMTEPQSLVKVNFNSPRDINDTMNRTEPYEIELKVTQTGEIDTYIGYFDLHLTDDITITSNPTSAAKESQRAIAWQQAVFFDNIPKSVKENDIIDAEFLMNHGKLTMLPEYNTHITRISPETLRFLNDVEYMQLITGCIGMACVYLGQMAEISQIHIIDLCPFPMFGLQLLKRGIQSLICCAKTDQDKHFFKKVFRAHDIPLSKVTILVGDDWSQDVFRDEKYHAVFCNIFEMCGEIELRFKEIAQHLKQNHLLQGGLFMPAHIKLMGQVVYSHWLDINNRIYDENVSNYKIEEYLNKYQVSQNYNIDFTHLEYTPLSEPCVLGTCTSPLGSETIRVPIVREGHPSAVLCWYNIELMEDMTEIATNRRHSFIDGVAFLNNSNTVLRAGATINLIRCVDTDGSFKVMLSEPS